MTETTKLSAAPVVAKPNPVVAKPNPAATGGTKNAAFKAAPTAFRIKSLSNKTKQSSYLNMIVYGVPGCGKSTLLASAADVPEMSDVLLMDLEDTDRVLYDNPRVRTLENIDMIRINNYMQLAEAEKFLKAHCRLRDDNSPKATQMLLEAEARFKGVPVSELGDTPRRYKTVILDSLSELDTMIIYELLGISSDMDLTKLFVDGDINTAKFDEYKKNNQVIQLLVRAFRDLPIHAVFTAHATYTQDELKKMHYAPVLTGKLRNQVQGLVDVVGYMQVGNADEKGNAPRRLNLHPVGRYDAKCRINNLKQPYLVNPVMADIYALIK